MTGPAYAELVAALRLEGAAIAAAAAQVDLDAPVAACPDWTVADLVAHVAGVYERTATLVARRATRW